MQLADIVSQTFVNLAHVNMARLCSQERNVYRYIKTICDNKSFVYAFSSAVSLHVEVNQRCAFVVDVDVI